MACIAKNNYDKILSDIERRNLSLLLTFLHNLPLFQSWPEDILLNLKYHFLKKIFIRNAYIYNQGDVADKVYIISNGEFRESSTITLNNEALPVVPEKKNSYSHKETFNAVRSPCFRPRLKEVTAC